jgi:hypothetical protein
MDRPFGELIATIIGGMLAIFTGAAVVLRHLRRRQLTQVNQRLDEVLADYMKAGDGDCHSTLSSPPGVNE